MSILFQNSKTRCDSGFQKCKTEGDNCRQTDKTGDNIIVMKHEARVIIVFKHTKQGKRIHNGWRRHQVSALAKIIKKKKKKKEQLSIDNGWH